MTRSCASAPSPGGSPGATAATLSDMLERERADRPVLSNPRDLLEGFHATSSARQQYATEP